MKKYKKEFDRFVKYLHLKHIVKSNEVELTPKDIQYLNAKGFNINECLNTLNRRGYIEESVRFKPISKRSYQSYHKIKLLQPFFDYYKEIEKIKRAHFMEAVGIISAIALLTNNFFNIGDTLISLWLKLFPSGNYETFTKWLDINQGLDLITDKSKLNLSFDCAEDSTYLYNGVSLITNFTNITDVEREVVSFTVSAMDIVEDLSPVLNLHPNQYKNIIGIEIYNNGWGETGILEANIESISSPFLAFNGSTPIWEKNGDDIAEIHLLKRLSFNQCMSIKPGEKFPFPVICTDYFDISWKDSNIKNFYFQVCIRLQSLEVDYSKDICVPIEVSADGINLAHNDGYGGGEEEEKNIIVIDTSESSWHKTFNMYYPIPAKKTEMLSVFLFPTKSCTMNLEVSFQMSDGEVIKVHFENEKKFVISYYDDLSLYINNEFSKWENVNIIQ